MWNKIKNIDLFKESTYSVVGVVLGDIPVYNILICTKEKEELSISESVSTTDFSQIEKIVSKSKPLLLNFSGKGIVSKKVESNRNYIKEVLFNASSEDFYIYTLFEGKNNFVSIGRKEVIDIQFNLFKKAGYKPLDYSIGYFVSRLSKNIFNEEDAIILDTSTLEFKDDILISFNSYGDPDKNYSFGEEILNSKDVVLLSTILNFLYSSDDIQYEKGFLDQNFKEQKNKKLFDYLALGSLVFFLITLFSSYLLLHYFNNEYVKYEQQLYHFNDDYFHIKNMEEDLLNKQFIAKNSGIMSSNFLSYYIHEIGSSTPSEIVLTNLKVNPISKKIKNKEEIKIEANTIFIMGEAKRSSSVNKWVKELKKNKWINSIEILNLNSDAKGNDIFSLKIVMI
ncbi:hypothetical protein [uncultured Maribacter sp.]|uniref:hypothetical protein n=1 Tax=uncultured Maribacter sp. TaxID=431308 RepID=UPI00263641B0|nr:hypothetical protein [uncultured Maribacter sp.]